MNWNRAKTILIIFFICTNLFLLVTIILSTGRTSIVTDDIVASTVMILKNNRIDIDASIIPRRTQSLPMIEAKNWIDDYDAFSKKIAGSDAKLIDNNEYSGENGSVVFNGDKFEFTSKSPMYQNLTRDINENNARQTALSILKNYGFEDSNLDFDIKSTGGQFIVSITKQKDGLFYFNSRIEMILAKTGLEKISGSWFFEKSSIKEKTTLKSVTGVLIDYISFANRPTTQEKITALDLGYSVLEEEIYHKEILLTPCWRITLDDGSEYILNAVENHTLD